MTTPVCGAQLMLPINTDGDVIACRQPEAEPDYHRHTIAATCELPTLHPGDHHRPASYGTVAVTWPRDTPTEAM